MGDIYWLIYGYHLFVPFICMIYGYILLVYLFVVLHGNNYGEYLLVEFIGKINCVFFFF